MNKVFFGLIFMFLLFNNVYAQKSLLRDLHGSFTSISCVLKDGATLTIHKPDFQDSSLPYHFAKIMSYKSLAEKGVVFEKESICYYINAENEYFCEGKDNMEYIKIDRTSEKKSSSINIFGGGVNEYYTFESEIKYRNKSKRSSLESIECYLKKSYY